MRVGVLAVMALAAVAAAQTCPCSFAPTGSEPRVVLNTLGTGGNPSTCSVRTLPTGGCFCVVDEGNAGECEINSEAVQYEFIGGGPQCVAVSNPIAVCPAGVEARTTRCEIDTNVAWTLDCVIPASEFPDDVTITDIQLRISQTDNFTFTGTGPVNNAVSLSYQTINQILPINAFPDWEDTPIKSTSGNIPASGTITYSAGSTAPFRTLNALPAGIAFANSNLGSLGVVFRFTTQLGQQSSGFTETEFFPIFSRVVVDMTASFE
eukprot:CAMPEP_0185838764 /NCGR_PEP_ID=MMETSP1353-20130828/13543_1 /TAXON_ID=1077150 /ORGANISM="Erythrolobus australicus, Strain CCMP3124" /LENGTH=263 /DNA_ID=CAMNT_0028537855 /DNA_START=221 /DNA_END=1012 /DNA_ORIENTATION=-